jgi:hypothetical protein
MIPNYRKRKEVRQVFIDNPNLSIYSISEIVGLSPTQVSEYLNNDSLYLTASLSESNLYFLFTSILEKRVVTDPFKNVRNGYQFSQKEKDFLRSYGFNF